MNNFSHLTEQRTVFVIIPFGKEFADVYTAVQEAVNISGSRLDINLAIRRGDESFGNSALEDLKRSIENSDLIVADASFANPNVLFELGHANALGKPIIVINQQDTHIPFDLSQIRVLFYDRNRLGRDLIPHLADAVTIALREPNQFIGNVKSSTSNRPKAFVSYSHNDKASLNRMMVHLKPLEKQGLLDIWQDTKIEAGDRWKEQIGVALDEAAIAVLLISADFLASDFIVDNELPPLLKAAEERGKRILPVILKPCRFARDKHLSRFQALNDPSVPLLFLSEVEQEAVWDRLALAIENEIEGYVP